MSTPLQLPVLVRLSITLRLIYILNYLRSLESPINSDGTRMFRMARLLQGSITCRF